MNKIHETLDKLRKLGFNEDYPPSPIHGHDCVIGSIWHYYNPRTKVRLDYNWYANKFSAWFVKH